MIVGPSGCGKSTFIRAYCLRYPAVIKHTLNSTYVLYMLQVPWIVSYMPADGSTSTLYIEFLNRVDAVLGTRYSDRAGSVRLRGRADQVMAQVAASISLGVLVIDDFHNVFASRDIELEATVHFLRHFSRVTGVAVVLVGHPETQHLAWKLQVKNLETIQISPLQGQDWVTFTEALWRYQLVKRPLKMTKDINTAWFRASKGNPGVAARAFVLAQRSSIGASESVDADSFNRIATDPLALRSAASELGDFRTGPALGGTLFPERSSCTRQ